MDASILVATLAVVGVTQLAAVVGSTWQQRRQKRALARKVGGGARVEIAAVREGQSVRVVGELVGPLPLIAPLTHRRCACWTVEVEVRGVLGYWTARGRRVGSEPTSFTIRDRGGQAVIETAGADVVIALGAGRQLVRAADDETTRWAERCGLWRLPAGVVRLVEGALTADHPIAVVGVGAREPDPDATGERGYRDAPPTRLHLSSTAGHPLFITDAPAVTAR